MCYSLLVEVSARLHPTGSCHHIRHACRRGPTTIVRRKLKSHVLLAIVPVPVTLDFGATAPRAEICLSTKMLPHVTLHRDISLKIRLHSGIITCSNQRRERCMPNSSRFRGRNCTWRVHHAQQSSLRCAWTLGSRGRFTESGKGRHGAQDHHEFMTIGLLSLENCCVRVLRNDKATDKTCYNTRLRLLLRWSSLLVMDRA